MKRTNTLPFFQVDSGQLLYDSMGQSLEQMGIYVLLMAMYWENECKLPPRENLVRKLKLSARKAAVMDEVIDTFFPDGIHANLDLCKENALQTSRRNAANARRGHARQQGIVETRNPLQVGESDPSEF